MKKLAGKKAIITGASSGIGRAIAMAFANEGAEVIINYSKNQFGAEEVVNALQLKGLICKAIQADVTKPADREKLVTEAIEFLQHVDILVNNAGIAHRAEFFDTTEDDFDRIIDVNFKSLYFLTQKVTRYMIHEKHKGSIINISSVSDQVTSASHNLFVYEASKAAVSRLTKSLALALAPYEIRVNTIAPGLVATNANRDQWESNPAQWKKRYSTIPLGRPGQPEDLAWAAVYLASDEAAWTTGARFTIDGGSTAY